MRDLAAGSAEVIRVDAAWFAVEPLDLRAGADTALARVVNVFGQTRAHHALSVCQQASEPDEGAGT